MMRDHVIKPVKMHKTEIKMINYCRFFLKNDPINLQILENIADEFMYISVNNAIYKTIPG